MRALKPALTFLIDSREQLAFRFGPPVRKEFRDGGSLVRGLSEGDYTVCIDSGAPLSIRIERKSLGDLYGCIPHETGCSRDLREAGETCGKRCRFEKELQRLVQYERTAIIIEASADDVLRGYERSLVTPKAVMASLLCWYARFGVAPIFGESHRRAGGIAQRILEEFATHYLEAQRGKEIEHPMDGRLV